MPDPRIFTFSATFLNEIQMCARKVELGYVRELVPLVKAEALDRGAMLHEILATYRILLKLTWRGGDPATLSAGEAMHLKKYEILAAAFPWRDIIDAAIMTGRQYMASSDLNTEEGEIVINNFVDYSDYYQNDGWQPLEIEATFSRVIYEDPDLILIFEGIIDLLTDSRAGRTVVDSKSASRRQTPSLLSNQFMGYAWAFEVPSITVDKIGFQKTLGPKDRFQRYVLSYAEDLKKEWKHWAIYWAKIGVFYMENNIFPPNFTSCDKFGGCIFEQVCKTTPGAREWKAGTLFRKESRESPLDKLTSEVAATVGGSDAQS